jgi:transposase
MPNFKQYNQSQLMLLPPDIRDTIPTDHIGFVINDVVDTLNLSTIEHTYTNTNGGASAYSPRLLIKVLFYAYATGIRSSRFIEKYCRENLVFLYLSAGACPDHGTINLFRKKHLTGLETIFAHIVILLGQMNMTDFSNISIDGSIFQASASKKNTFNREEITKWKKRIKKILKEAEDIDKEEDKQYGKDNRGTDQIPARLKDPKTRQAEIKRLVEKMNKLNTANKKIKDKQNKVKNKTTLIRKASQHNNHNIIDEDANLMKLKNTKAVKPAYNGQITTSNQIILAYDIVDKAIDEPSLIPMIEKTQTNTNQPVYTLKADCGYWSKDNIKELTTNHTTIDAFIPDRRKSFEEKGIRDNTLPKHHRTRFTYDKDKDIFISPNKDIYRLKITNRDKQGNIISQRYFREQTIDKTKINITNKDKGPEKTKDIPPKQICIDWELEHYKTTMRNKLNTKKGKQIYLQRMSEVEPVFGNIKHNQKLTTFLCRGKPIVKTEFGLSCIAHNLTKLTHYLKNKEHRQQFNLLLKQRATI